VKQYHILGLITAARTLMENEATGGGMRATVPDCIIRDPMACTCPCLKVGLYEQTTVTLLRQRPFSTLYLQEILRISSRHSDILRTKKYRKGQPADKSNKVSELGIQMTNS
jgi:hypothetical protein